MKKFTTSRALAEAMKTLTQARDEAQRKGDVENLINIGITFYEFALKLPADSEEKVKNHIGFVGEKDD